MEIHEVANIFPMMNEDEYAALVEDIRANGLREPIWTHDGKIIDGRNRYKACVEAGITPQFRAWDGKGSLVEFVVSLNLKRRHLTSEQRAFVALDMLPHLEQEARERYLATQNNDTGRAATQNFGEQDKGESVEHAAKLANTNPEYVRIAKKLTKEAPELAKKVKAGKKKLYKANKEHKQSTAPKTPLHIPTHRRVPTIYCASADDMPIESESVDVIVTSPPYNLGDSSWPMGGEGRTERAVGIGYQDDLDEMEYQAWQVRCLIEMFRVAKPGASLFYNHKVRTKYGAMIHPMDWLRSENNPWVLRQELVWDRKSTHNHNPTLFYPEDERIYWMTKGVPTLPDHSIGQSTILREFGPQPNRSEHPAPFPDAIPITCLKAVINFNSSNEHIVVLDPFMGSGTTLRVALSYGCQAIGIDLSEEYIELAKRENSWTKE